MSSDYKIKISEARAVELRQQADALDITINTLIAQIVEGHTLGPLPTPLPPSSETAADYFLSQLEPEHRKLIEDCAKETDRSIASYLLGYIKLAHDQGNTAKVLPEALDTTITKPPAPSSKSCEWCQMPLEDVHARYCPDKGDGTESCGRQASLAVLREARRSRTTGKELPHPHVVQLLKV